MRICGRVISPSTGFVPPKPGPCLVGRAFRCSDTLRVMDDLVLPAWLTLLLVVLATARIWRLLAVDGITEGFRIRLIASVQDRPRRWRDAFHDLYFCPFCMGFYVLLGVLASALAWHDEVAWQLIVGALALNYVSGQLNAHLDVDDSDLSR